MLIPSLHQKAGDFFVEIFTAEIAEKSKSEKFFATDAH
jgi:hypothetical protein